MRIHDTFFLLAFALAGCSPSTGPHATPANGGGVCCPVTAAPGCNPTGDFGGWSASESGCRMQSLLDGCPAVMSMDDHGCAVLSTSGCSPSSMCGAAPPPRDAGDDATDAGGGGTDAHTNDPRCPSDLDQSACGGPCTVPGLDCEYPGSGGMFCHQPDAGDPFWQCVIL